MRRTPKFLIITAAMAAVLLLQAVPSEAQRRRPVRRTHTTVVIGGGFGYYNHVRFAPFYWGGFYGWSPFLFDYHYSPWYYHGPDRYDGSVRLQVKPRETQVYVNGFFAGTVDDFDGVFQRLRLRPGEYEIVLFHRGYRSVRQSIRLAPGQDFKVEYRMQPLAAGEPEETPPTAPPPPSRREAPAIDAPGSDRPEPPVRAPIELPRRDRSIDERDPIAQGFGTLSIRVQPAGAEVIVDGERWQGPEGAERLNIQLSQGSHRVEIRKDGHVTYSTEVQVRPGEALTLNVSLPPQR